MDDQWLCKMRRGDQSLWLGRKPSLSCLKLELRDNVVFSNEITQLILSYGRLMDAGWSMRAGSKCLNSGVFEVPFKFQNHSLIVKGRVRRVCAPPQVVRAVKADLMPGLQRYVDIC